MFDVSLGRHEILEDYGIEGERVKPIAGIVNIPYLVQRQTQVSQSAVHNDVGEIHDYGDGNFSRVAGSASRFGCGHNALFNRQLREDRTVKDLDGKRKAQDAELLKSS